MSAAGQTGGFRQLGRKGAPNLRPRHLSFSPTSAVPLRPKSPTCSWEGPAVRISFPPPASLSHQCLPCLPPQRPGFCRECEPGRDQRTGRAGPEPARLGCFSLTGIAAVPPQEIKAQQREEPRPWPGHPLLRVALQLARRLRCSVQSSGRSSSMRRVAVSLTGCRPCRIASTSSGLKKARSTRRRT